MSKHVERWSFVLSVISGIVAAVAGGSGWAVTSIVAGCLAAAAPIAGRYASGALAKAAEAAANAKIAAAEQQATVASAELNALQLKLLPRKLTEEQINSIVADLKTIAPFRIGVAHNRHEAEPKIIHEQLCSALKAGGMEISWFGGMTNTTVGIEISGPPNQDKHNIMAIFAKAGVKFLDVTFSDDPEGKRGVEIWVGVHPGIAG